MFVRKDCMDTKQYKDIHTYHMVSLKQWEKGRDHLLEGDNIPEVNKEKYRKVVKVARNTTNGARG